MFSKYDWSNCTWFKSSKCEWIYWGLESKIIYFIVSKTTSFLNYVLAFKVYLCDLSTLIYSTLFINNSKIAMAAVGILVPGPKTPKTPFSYKKS